MKPPSWETAVGGLRKYQDEEALERVWNRLSARRGRSSGLRPMVQLLSAAALLGAGVWIGMRVERSTADDPLASVRGEVIVPVGTAPGDGESREFRQRRHRAAPDGASEGPSKPSAKRNRHASSSLQASEGGEELAEEEPSTESEDAAGRALLVQQASWLELAERGDFAAAFSELDQSGGFDAALLSAGPDELMTLVDVARTMGRDGRAVQALRIVVEQYREDDNAPLAAMMLGNLLSRLGDAEGAAKAFALNRSLSPGGDFAEDALVREFEMAVDASDVLTARRLRVQYEQEYPDGRHHDELRTEFERLVAEVEAASGAIAWPGDETGKSADADEDREAGAVADAAAASASEGREPASEEPTNPYAVTSP